MSTIKAFKVISEKGSRPGQEDHVLVEREKGIFVVADGFGGPTPGARAAKAACDAVQQFLVKEAGDLEATMPFVLRSYFSLAGNVLFNALVHANRKVLSLNRGKGVHEKGGASVLAGFMDGNLLALANVGSCTASLFRSGQCAELVMPRTYGRLIDPFVSGLSPEAGNVSAPLMAAGIAEDLEPEIFEYRVREGDWILIQTDGLSPDIAKGLGAIQQKALSTDQSLGEVENLLKTIKSNSYIDNAAASLLFL